MARIRIAQIIVCTIGLLLSATVVQRTILCLQSVPVLIAARSAEFPKELNNAIVLSTSVASNEDLVRNGFSTNDLRRIRLVLAWQYTIPFSVCTVVVREQSRATCFARRLGDLYIIEVTNANGQLQYERPRKVAY
jgi:hypothetical protein